MRKKGFSSTAYETAAIRTVKASDTKAFTHHELIAAFASWGAHSSIAR